MIFRDRSKAEAYVGRCIGSSESIHDISTPSYAFQKKSKGETSCDTLCRIFDIKEREKFKTAFGQVVSGQGNESGNILTIHSSALLALLCFYNVSNENPLVIQCNSTFFKFDKVYFEVENIVKDPKDRHSSIDIALYSTDQNVMLLLESKFTEPLTGGNLRDVREKYIKRLKPLHQEGINYIDSSKTFECKKRNIGPTKHYIYYEGIKQMVAHLMGAETGPAPANSLNKANELKKQKQEEYFKCFELADEIYLGCILFNDESFFDDYENNMIGEYINLYEGSMEILSKSIVGKNKNKIYLLTQPKTYQEVFNNNASSYKLLSKVAEFYHL